MLARLSPRTANVAALLPGDDSFDFIADDLLAAGAREPQDYVTVGIPHLRSQASGSRAGDGL